MTHDSEERDLHRGYALVDHRFGLPVVAYRAICGAVELEVITDLGPNEAACELLRHAALIGVVNRLGSTIIVSAGAFTDDDTDFFNTRYLAFCEDIPEVAFYEGLPE